MKVKTSKKWFVLYTKPRNELKVVERLSKLGMEVYTPTRMEVRQWSDRKKKIITPLLPSMILVCVPEKDAHLVFHVPGVVRYLFEHGKRATVSNEEVLALQFYVDGSLQTAEKEVVVGDHIVVPLLEEKATVLSVKGKKCLAQLQKLGAVVSFQLS